MCVFVICMQKQCLSCFYNILCTWKLYIRKKSFESIIHNKQFKQNQWMKSCVCINSCSQFSESRISIWISSIGSVVFVHDIFLLFIYIRHTRLILPSRFPARNRYVHFTWNCVYTSVIQRTQFQLNSHSHTHAAIRTLKQHQHLDVQLAPNNWFFVSILFHRLIIVGLCNSRLGQLLSKS